MKNLHKQKKIIKITDKEFDEKFEQGKDITKYLDLKAATVVKRVNVDFPAWMVVSLDQEATKLNVSRQAIIKMWIHERLNLSQYKIAS